MSASFSLVLACVLAPPISESVPHFETEVLPVLTKAGCNAGSCHGAAAGRGGFHLSLWGSDPAADYEAIVEEFEGRRVNLVHPEQSLILRKPTGITDHEGGIPLPEDSEGAARLLRWIAGGAPRGSARPLKDFVVSPETRVVNRGESVVLRAQAGFAGEALKDVTRWTVWKPADPAAVTIDPKTTSAMIHRPGQHVVIARFLNRVVPVQLLAPYGNQAVDHSQESRANFIDDLVLERLQSLRLPVSPLSDSSTFIRRVTLDLTGRLPDPETVERFARLEREHPQQIAAHREKLIDQLLASEEFADFWTHRLGELLRVGQSGSLEQARVFHGWLREQIRSRRPMDELTRELITATGDPLQSGPANFYLVAGDARGQAEYVSQALLGVRLRCANCHNHPLDRWTQDDYHGFAAVFARVDRGRIVRQKDSGTVIHPKTGEAAIPRIPGMRDLTAEGDLREPVADWLTDSDNPYFSRAIVNRLWQAMMGRGVVDPTDDLSETNPPTHPELLDRLSADFAENGYDLRRTLKQIAVSRSYQRSSQTVGVNGLDDRFYSHRIPRKLSAEVLVDAWCDVTGVAENYPNQPKGTRAIELVSPRIESRSLDVLGRCARDGECEASGNSPAEAALAADLHVLNGEILNAKLAAPQGRLHSLLQSKAIDEEILSEFYLRAFSRPPRHDEKAYWLKQFSKASTRQTVLEDWLWSVLTCREFTTNH